MSTLAVNDCKVKHYFGNRQTIPKVFYFEHKSHESHKSFQRVSKSEAVLFLYIFFRERGLSHLFLLLRSLSYIGGMGGIFLCLVSFSLF